MEKETRRKIMEFINSKITIKKIEDFEKQFEIFDDFRYLVNEQKRKEIKEYLKSFYTGVDGSISDDELKKIPFTFRDFEKVLSNLDMMPLVYIYIRDCRFEPEKKIYADVYNDYEEFKKKENFQIVEYRYDTDEEGTAYSPVIENMETGDFSYFQSGRSISSNYKFKIFDGFIYICEYKDIFD